VNRKCGRKNRTGYQVENSVLRAVHWVGRSTEMPCTCRILSINPLVQDVLEIAGFIVLRVAYRNCKCMVMQCDDLSSSRQFHSNSLDNEELVLHFSFNKHFFLHLSVHFSLLFFSVDGSLLIVHCL
jgi:hypothetical protein